MERDARDRPTGIVFLYKLVRAPGTYRPNFISAVAIVLGLALLALALYGEIPRFRFLFDSKPAQATVETYSHESGGKISPGVTDSRVTFRTEDGQVVHVALHIVGISGIYGTGKTVAVRYLASDPHEVRTEAQLWNIFSNLTFFLGAFFFLVLGYLGGKTLSDGASGTPGAPVVRPAAPTPEGAPARDPVSPVE